MATPGSCAAWSRGSDTVQLKIKCKKAEAQPGLFLCERHAPWGAEPRLPPRFYGDRILEELIFYDVTRVCIITLPDGRTRERQLEINQCTHVLQKDAHGVPTKRCANRGNFCWPYCPAHLITNLFLWPDLQLIIPGEFQLGLYAFRPGVGLQSPVFVKTAQIASSLHYSAFPTLGAPVAGQQYYFLPCAHEQSYRAMETLFGQKTTMPYTFEYSGPRALESVLLDTTFRRGCLTLANTTSPATACNATIVNADETVSVALCAAKPIYLGQAIFVNYEGEGDKLLPHYDFQHMPTIHYRPPFPPPPAAGTLYDFCRLIADQQPTVPLPPLPGLVGAGLRIQQTKLLEIQAAMQFYDNYAYRFATLHTLPFLQQSETWVEMVAHGLACSHNLGIQNFIDRMLERGGDLFLRTFRYYCTQERVRVKKDCKSRFIFQPMETFEHEDPTPAVPHFLRLVMYMFLAAYHPHATPDDIILEAAPRVHWLNSMFQASPVWGYTNGIAAEAVIVALYMGGLPESMDWGTLPICAQLLAEQRKFYHKLNKFSTLPKECTHVNLPLALFCPWASLGCSTETYNRLFKQLTCALDNTPLTPIALGLLHHQIFAVYTEALNAVVDFFETTTLTSVAQLRTVFHDVWFPQEQNYARAVCDLLTAAGPF